MNRIKELLNTFLNVLRDTAFMATNALIFLLFLILTPWFIFSTLYGQINENSPIHSLRDLNILELMQSAVSVFLVCLLFFLFCLVIIVLPLHFCKNASNNKVEKALSFLVKFSLASYFPLLLLIVADERLFNFITAIVSFLALFGFIFKMKQNSVENKGGKNED